MSKALVIYNPVAGRGRVQAQWPLVDQALRQAGIDFDAVPTRAPLEACRLAREAHPKYNLVVSVGGDGTTHEIVNGLMQASGEAESLPLAILPLGSGDDFAKALPPETPVGGKLYDWRVAIEKIVRRQTRLFDVVRLTGDHLRPDLAPGPHYFMNGLDVGFGAQAVYNFTSIPRFFKGSSAYLLAILKTLIRYPRLHLTLQIDDGPPFEQVTSITAVMNGRSFGSSFWACPEARADDGLLDLVIAQGLGRLQILQLLPKLARGTHLADPAISTQRARRVVIRSVEPLVVEADGELPFLATHQITLEILPGRLRLLV
jgi:YegS/Rv2252/BmrU family lipid kinase